MESMYTLFTIVNISTA